MGTPGGVPTSRPAAGRRAGRGAASPPVVASSSAGRPALRSKRREETVEHAAVEGGKRQHPHAMPPEPSTVAEWYVLKAVKRSGVMICSRRRAGKGRTKGPRPDSVEDTLHLLAQVALPRVLATQPGRPRGPWRTKSHPWRFALHLHPLIHRRRHWEHKRGVRRKAGTNPALRVLQLLILLCERLGSRGARRARRGVNGERGPGQASELVPRC